MAEPTDRQEHPEWEILEIPLEDIESIVLRRLVAEVRREQKEGLETPTHAYNRIYNRHHRS